jgi:hypothetical protein
MSIQNTKQTSEINGCPFCRSKKMPWANHTITNCRNLKKNKCEYCHFIGHAVSHCQTKIDDNRKKFEQEEIQRRNRWEANEAARRHRWEENQRLKQEEKVRKEEEKAKSWAVIANKNISEEMGQKIANANQIAKEKERQAAEAKKIKRAQEAKERRENWERNYPYRMSKKYGIKEDFIYDVENPCTIMAYKGDFWEFYVENTPDDHEIARNLRTSEELKRKFRDYLQEKYWTNWLWQVLHTNDDCIYLCKLRQEAEDAEYQAEIWREKKEQECEAEEKKIKKEMIDKLQRGEISKKEYEQWNEEEEDYLETIFENEGYRMYNFIERNNLLKEQWEYRDAARKGDTGFHLRKQEQKRKEKEAMDARIAEIDAKHKEFLKSWNSYSENK